MNKTNYLIIAVALLLLVSPINAAGIKWFTTSEYVKEGTTKCITYGVYNPFDNDVISEVTLSGDIKSVTDFSSTEFLVEANTFNTEAKPVEICFSPKDMYKENCLLGPIVCEKTCNQETISVTGEVVVADRLAASERDGSGSAVTISASAPLELLISCESHPLDLVPIYFIIVTIVLVLLIVFVFRKKREPTYLRKQRKIKKLQEKIDKEQRSLRKTK